MKGKKGFLLLICVFPLIQCSKKEVLNDSFAASAAGHYASSEREVSEDSKKADQPELAAVNYTYENNRKLVVTADLTLRLDDLKVGEKKLNGIMEKHAAYAAESRIDRNSLYFLLKIPSSAYKKCFTELREIGEIIYSTEKTQDVTMNYYDLESRLNTKRELIKTYQSYLGKAQNIDDILSVERQIAGLQNEIDMSGREFRVLTNDVDYATIDLELRGVNAGLEKETFGDRVKLLLSGFGDFISYLGIALIGIIIYVIPIIIILAALYWLLFGKIGLLKKLWRFIKTNSPSH